MKTKKLIIKGVSPLFTRIITTSDRYNEADSVDANGLIDPKKAGSLKDIQTIVEIGTSVRFVKPGDKVSLNLSRYGKTKYHKNSTAADMDENYNAILSYEVPMIKIESQEMLFIDEGDVEFIVRDFEEIEIEVNLSGLATVPMKSKLILN